VTVEVPIVVITDGERAPYSEGRWPHRRFPAILTLPVPATPAAAFMIAFGTE
jgi:hypothetical protein